MGKRKGRTHELERYSRGRLRMTLSQWVVNSLDEDYAFDFEVRPTERIATSNRDQHGDMVLPSPFYVQLKASRGFDDPASVWVDLETEYLVDDCLQASVPVVLVICDRRREALYWCVLQRYCWDVLDANHAGWRDQTTVRVRIDREPLAESIRLWELRGAVRDAEHRIATRQRVAAARRGTLHHPSRMHVASLADVRAYKRDLVEEGVALALAGRFERARSKLLEVCQMAEAGRPTVAAYRYLLELREIDDPAVAFTKIRFAREGAQLATQYDDTALLDGFQEHYKDAWAYINERFIGAKYIDSTGFPILVLEVEQLRLLEGTGANMTACVQHGVEFTDLQAPAIAANDEFGQVESGEDTNPRGDACPERDHHFDRTVLEDAPIAAICTDCGLSGDTLQQWLGHDIPRVCGGCGEIVYEKPLDMEVLPENPQDIEDPQVYEQLLCTDCRS